MKNILKQIEKRLILILHFDFVVVCIHECSFLQSRAAGVESPETEIVIGCCKQPEVPRKLGPSIRHYVLVATNPSLYYLEFIRLESR